MSTFEAELINRLRNLLAAAEAEVDGLRTRLTAAETATQRLLDGWRPGAMFKDGSQPGWVLRPAEHAQDAPDSQDWHIMTGPERDWLARVAADTPKEPHG